MVYAPETLADQGVAIGNGGMSNFVKLVEFADPDVVVIDTWRLFVGGDENKPETAIKGLKALARLRRGKPRLAFILVHHLRKERLESPVRLRDDPYTWIESVSGHHALVGHADACYGLEHEITGVTDELIVFAGISRSGFPPTLLLQEDIDTLRFEVCPGEEAAKSIMTPRERDLWTEANALRSFTFTELLTRAKTTNRKAVASMLRKAESHSLLRKEGDRYVRV